MPFPTLIVAAVLVATVTSPATAATGTPSTCDTASGPVTVNVASQGATYPVEVYVPAHRDRRAALVLNLHGSNSNGAQQLRYSQLDQVADREGFLIAVPDGAVPFPDSPGNFAWNVPGVPITAGTYPPPGTRDDVQFLHDTATTIAAKLCGDLRRVYLTGFSGGGRMTSYFGCHDSLAAAIAPVSGLRAGTPQTAQPEEPLPDCTPSRPVPVMTFHGTLDPVNPYDGGGAPYWQYSVTTALDRWAEIDHCYGVKTTRQVTAHVTHTVYHGCAAHSTVQAYIASDAGHTWPGTTADSSPQLGPVNTEINASELMWRFFRAHSLPVRPMMEGTS